MLAPKSNLLALSLLCTCAGCVGVMDFIASSSAPVTSHDYDALWNATHAALRRRGPISRADKEKGYMATEPQRRQWRRDNPRIMPATVHSIERIEARLHKRADGSHEVKVRVYEEQSAPHDFRLYRSDIKPAKPEGRLHLVNHDTAATRSALLEKAVLDDITAELATQGGAGE